MLSVNTNSGAMIALQYLDKTNAQLQTTQNAINSGLKVATAKDDGSTFAIAQNMRGDVAGYSAVTDSLNRGTSVVDVAMSAGQSISDLLIEMKQKAAAASDASLDTASRQALNEDFESYRDQITSIIQNAVFNGFNLIDGSATGGITALASSDGVHKITVGSDLPSQTCDQGRRHRRPEDHRRSGAAAAGREDPLRGQVDRGRGAAPHRRSRNCPRTRRPPPVRRYVGNRQPSPRRLSRACPRRRT